MEKIISLAILIFSAIIHEVMHGVIAEKFGDSTARDEGRITLNPIPHIDPFGSILLPGLMIFAGSPIIFGAAKPVPVNINNMNNPRAGMAAVSFIGPFTNLILAILFLLPVKLGLVSGQIAEYWIMAVYINLMLAVLNALPIPPLDGSKFLASFLPTPAMNWLLSLERFGFIIILVFLFSGVFNKIFYTAINIFGKIFGV